MTDRRHPPSLADLTARYLAAQPAPAAEAEVEPHEAVGGFRAPAAQTWADALAAVRACGVEPEKLPMPPEWAAFATREGADVAVPCAAGFCPQQVRDLAAVFQLVGGRKPAGQVAGFGGLRGWLRTAARSKSPTTLLVAAGVAASLGDRAEAEAALTAADPLCDGPWRAAWQNQRAAVSWLFGETGDWPATGPAADFNRGLAALAAGKPADAARHLQTVADQLAAGTGWPHLAGLYLTVARAGH